MKAQGLSKPITSYAQMMGCDNRLFLSVERGAVRGLIRVGKRQLFLRRRSDSDYIQLSPLCVLDFYVCENLQRSGEGKALFEHMRLHEGVDAASLGYDRPSPKFLGFLRKHYGLSSYTPQSNFFVLFDEYWNRHGHPGSAVRGDSRAGRPRASADPPEAAATHHGARPRLQLSAAGTTSRPGRVAAGFLSWEGPEQPTGLPGQTNHRPPALSQSNLECAGGEMYGLGVQQAEPMLPAEWSSRPCASAEAGSYMSPEHDSLTSLLQQSSHPPAQPPPPPEPVALRPDHLLLSRQAVATAQRHGPLAWQTTLTPQGPAAVPPDLPSSQRHWCTNAAATGPHLQANPLGGPLSRAYQEKHGFVGRSVSRLRDQVAVATVPHLESVGAMLHPQNGLNTSMSGTLRADPGQVAAVPLGRHAQNYGTGAGIPSRRQAQPHQMVRLLTRPY